MINLDLTYLIPMILSIGSFFWLIFRGKKLISSTNKYIKYVPLIAILSMIIGVFLVSDYYDKQSELDKEKLLLLEKQKNIADSIFISNKLKAQTLDSLKKIDEELNQLLYNINRREKIIGKNAIMKNEIKKKIIAINKEIGIIKSYNELIETPNYLKSGYYTNQGNSTNFLFICPTNKESEYIDLKMRFKNDTFYKNIACIYIDIVEKKNGEYWLLYDQAFRPKQGVNAFKIKNFSKTKNTSLSIGYILKSETKMKTPTLEKITCDY